MPKKKSPQTPTTILALKRPSPPPTIEKPMKDEVISLPATEEPVSDHAASCLPLSQKPSIEVTKNTDVSSPVELVTESIDSDPDPLIGSQIEVIAPWGAKVFAEISGVYCTPGGEKWVWFNALDEIPDGWSWRGGVKKIDATVA